MGDSSSLKAAFKQAGQEQVFQFFDTLNEEQQNTLLSQCKSIDLEEIQKLSDSLIHSTGEDSIAFDQLEPAPYISLPERRSQSPDWVKAKEIGEEALKAGRVAAFTVAGGQGTRLGYNGPKGTFPATPLKEKSLFQIFAEKIRNAEAKYGKRVYWFIMTSQHNHADTTQFFESNNFFGLNAEQVQFFPQGLMPALSPQGKIMLESKDKIAMSPDGHGGSLRALVRSGAIDTMEREGVDIISYFQVDNPLVRCLDPEFIGFHISNESEMSSKMVRKAYASEKVGHFCQLKGQQIVVEYSDMPEDLAAKEDSNKDLLFHAGSIAVHILSRDFVKRVGSENSLPFHRANKKIKTIAEDGSSITPEEPNGIKLEMFVFDALPFAQNPTILETLRAREFSPVKNAEGVDSPKTSKEDQQKKFARWLIAAGENIPCNEQGLPDFTIEISPLFATTRKQFTQKWAELSDKPEIKEGFYLK